MPMLATASRVGLMAAVAVVAAFAARFYRGQNARGRLGGRISIPKIAWLSYAIYVWFFLCPIVALDPGTPRGLKIALGAFAASMWIRGVAEMVMLYVTKNWRPPIGIAHDLFCIALLAGLGVVYRDQLGGHPWALGLYGAVLFSLVVEILYAALFFRAVEGKTTGAKGIWFADDDPQFQRINRITTTFNLPLYAFLLAFLVAAWVPAP